MNQTENNFSKCPICGRPTHKESKYCIFHASAEEKTEEEFKKALKEYVDKIKKEDKLYDFKKFIFVGNIDFKDDFNISVFNKNAIFSNATFDGDANFYFITFKGVVFFNDTTFKGNANFIDTTCEIDANFVNATFKGNVFFDYTTLKGVANFMNSTFPPGKEWHLNIKEGAFILFEKTFLENVFLDLNLNKGVLIDFTDVLLRNTKITREQINDHILQEKKKEFSKAKEIYLLLKNNFHSIGKYEDENWAFKKEKDMERKSNCHFKSLHKWLWSCFLNGIFGYGIHPSKVIISAIIIITLFAFLFMNPGISNVVGIEEITSKNFFDCIYFSTITFTTLGYGDFRPLEGGGRILAGSEAFIGAFMMALFVYTFARRTGGR